MNRLFIASSDEISHDCFFKAWEQEEQTPGHVADKNTNDRLAEQKKQTAQAPNLHYFSGTLTQTGLDAIVLPWHEEGYKVNYGGDLLWNVVAKYLPGIETEPDDDPCFIRLRRVIRELNDQFQNTGTLINTAYTLGRIYEDAQLAMPGHYSGHLPGKLFVGNIHRFLGYGLWTKQGIGYQPVKVYYFVNL